LFVEGFGERVAGMNVFYDPNPGGALGRD